MNSKLLWLIVAASVIAGLLYFLSRPGDHLNVTPDARRASEKAKSR